LNTRLGLLGQSEKTSFITAQSEVGVQGVGGVVLVFSRRKNDSIAATGNDKRWKRPFVGNVDIVGEVVVFRGQGLRRGIPDLDPV